MNNPLCDIGLVGLGVMGSNFALNMADRGFRVGVYNRTREKTGAFMEEEVDHRPIEPGYSLATSGYNWTSTAYRQLRLSSGQARGKT